ncbi:NTP transferase domain-containing protein [Roseomonas marmotae]|uniref:NTP transferase domain-containing protein n=1 Tax=Roseomonas marmotae TaxID=2768161 RepID=A0ABS3KAI8_9PROT|nr:molybdopterin-binding/glycosyltransferase family 2 protein [Roseomonas marmotae]MBO1074452.1 NTP transferase domain-containing protein [Roseomonas marmotae]QTI78188.1 NTP transferase domain-containing protein [Roseomonas marmotae]
MIFGPTPLSQAKGAILAHTVRLEGRVLKKGTLLDEGAVAALTAAGHQEVVAAQLEPGDVTEDEAAHRMGELLLGPHLTRTRAATGRVNLRADAAGLLVVDVALVDRLNALDESLTLATLPNFTPVSAGEMLATVKIIPFAMSGEVLEVAEAVISGGRLLTVHPFRALKVGLVLTELPGLKESIMEGAVEATAARVAGLTGTLLPPERCAHEEAPIAEALARLRRAGAELLLIAGASAVVDRRDAGPAAIVRAGGRIEHFGMPVDPGNLICLGQVEDVPAMVLPGCARSPKLNGFDWVLQRIFAGISVKSRDIMRMGVGGLLKEIESRPLPRAEAAKSRGGSPRPRRPRQVAALVLAAGRSSRMAPLNKLLVRDAEGRPMVARVVDNILASGARPVVVVTGHERQQVEAALAGKAVTLVPAEDFASGLSASLKAGLAALPPQAEGVVICLGDMPLVPGAAIDRMLAAFDPEEGRAIVQPSYQGRPGNPVLWSREFLPEMMALTGDTGARRLLVRHAERVAEVEMPDDAVLRDFDTPEALAAQPDFAGKR